MNNFATIKLDATIALQHKTAGPRFANETEKKDMKNASLLKTRFEVCKQEKSEEKQEPQ